MMTVEVRYFAALREQAGCSAETLQTGATTPGALYAELAARHGLTLPVGLLRVAINERYAEMNGPLHDGDRLAFIPPVSGG